MKEKSLSSLNGLGTLVGALLVALAGAAVFVLGVAAKASTGSPNLLLMLLGVLLVAAGVFILAGLYTVQPNQAAVLSLFGKYVGTVKDNGLRWNNPFYSKRRVSQRVRNFESGKLKVNELDGSPIEIAAVIVWQVVDASEAVYNVDDYESFVHIQSESALRAMATSYPYAAEIAQAMLQRQQANAVIAARTRIVAGAVGMVEMALAELQKNGVVQLDEERKAHMVSNLLTVLCSDRGTQPIVNAGSLY
jgi:regulator of protease activity HflC (stomatin/prohibitin superfamily)